MQLMHRFDLRLSCRSLIVLVNDMGYTGAGAFLPSQPLRTLSKRWMDSIQVAPSPTSKRGKPLSSAIHSLSKVALLQAMALCPGILLHYSSSMCVFGQLLILAREPNLELKPKGLSNSAEECCGPYAYIRRLYSVKNEYLDKFLGVCEVGNTFNCEISVFRVLV